MVDVCVVIFSLLSIVRGFDSANHVRTGVFKNHKPAHEIIDVEIRSELQAVMVLAQATAKFASLILWVV